MKVPRKWSDFLHVGENKKEWFHFLAKEISKHKFNEDQQLKITKGDQVLLINRFNTAQMPTSSHEEADSTVSPYSSVEDYLPTQYCVGTKYKNIEILCLDKIF